MRLAATCALLLVAGCDLLLGLDPAADAMPDVPCAELTPDEDGDCVVDGNDNCPGLANTDQLDRDDDLVGDTCDPRPNELGDTLVAFEGFGDPSTARLAWRDVEPGMPDQWRFEPGRVIHTDTTDSFSMLQAAQPIDFADVSVEVGLTFGAFGDPLDADAIVYADTLLDNQNGHQCALEPLIPAPGKNRALVQDTTLAGPTTSSSAPIDMLAQGTEVVMTLRRRTVGELGCRVTVGSTVVDIPTIVRDATATWPPPRYLAIYARRASLTVKWITVYRSP